jgi:N-acetylglucosamine-6-phosphate deacetylase
MATLNPARVLRMEHRKGTLEPGADADIVAFSPTGEVVRTIVDGMLN